MVYGRAYKHVSAIRKIKKVKNFKNLNVSYL